MHDSPKFDTTLLNVTVKDYRIWIIPPKRRKHECWTCAEVGHRLNDWPSDSRFLAMFRVRACRNDVRGRVAPRG